MEISKDEKDLVDSGYYDIAFCPVCESGTIVHRDSYECNCSYCGRKFEYKSRYKN